MYCTHSYNGEFCIDKMPGLKLYFSDVSLHLDKVRNIKISKRKERPNRDFSWNRKWNANFIFRDSYCF